MEGTNDGESLDAKAAFNKDGCMEGVVDGVSLGSAKLGWMDGCNDGASLGSLAAFTSDGCTEGVVDGTSLWSWWIVSDGVKL